MYVRATAGDCLYIPKNWYHAVIASTPSISISTFGHRIPDELIFIGGGLELKNIFHGLGVWRWGSCTCHPAGTPQPKTAMLIYALLLVGLLLLVAALGRALL